MFGQKRIKELESRIDSLTYACDSWKRIAEKHKATILNLNEEGSKMSNGVATHSSSNFSKEHDHRVFQNTPESTSDILVVDSRRKTFEEALSLAQELAAKYPANTYKVVSTVAVVKADIPVVTTQKARFE